MTSFPVFPYYRQPLPVTFRSLPVLDDVISGFYADCALSASERSELNAEKLMLHNGQYVYPTAYVTERESALPDAKSEPEMGYLDSPSSTYGGSAIYTMGLSGTVWPLHMGASLNMQWNIKTNWP